MGAVQVEATPVGRVRAVLSRFGAPLLLVVGGVAQLGCLWAARYPIAQDLSANLEASCQLLGLWRGDPVFTDVLFAHPLPWTHVTMTALVALVAAVVPSFAAMKVGLSIAMVALLASTLMLARAAGRPTSWAVLCLPCTFDLSFSFGFASFVLGKALVLAQLALAMALAGSLAQPRSTSSTSRRGPALLGAALVGCGALALVTHAMAWGIGAGMAMVAVALCSTTWRARAIGAACVAAPAVLAVPFLLGSRSDAGGRVAFRPLSEALSTSWDNLGQLGPLHGDELAWAAAAVCAIAVAVIGREGWDRRRTTLFACGALLVLGYLFGPIRLPQLSIVVERLPGLAVPLWLLALPRHPGETPTRLSSVLTPRRTAAVVALACVVECADLARTWRAFTDDEVGAGFEQLLAGHVQRGERVATWIVPSTSTRGRHNALWHWPKLACFSGAFTDDTFAYRGSAFVELRPDRRAFQLPPHRLGPALGDYSWLLSTSELAQARVAVPISLAGTSGRWRLYRVGLTAGPDLHSNPPAR